MIDLEPRYFIYNRTGNLSQTTALNTEVARQFMQLSDLRRDIVIVDSDKKPEGASVSVGSDILAWRSVASLGELTKVVFRPQKFHQTETVDNQYRVLIHDQIINDDIRAKGYLDREDYEKKYLARLKKEVKTAAVDVLFREKLGFRDQKVNYYLYLFNAPFLSAQLLTGNYLGVGLSLVSICTVCHAFTNSGDNFRMKRYQQLQEYANSYMPGYRVSVPPDINPRPWQQAFYPIVPIDKWIKGRRFLAQYGEGLIIPRS